MSKKTKLAAVVVILLLTVIMGVYTGIKNTSDYQISQFEFDEISANVQVYRDKNLVPTIIAQNEFDLFFAQGYEMARDRLWQLEFFRSVANGELSRILGADQVNADKYLRLISMRKIAEIKRNQISPDLEYILDAFVKGINKYISLHEHNLPIEFNFLNAKPKSWTITDCLAIQGVLSRTLSISGLEREIYRNKLARAFGPDQAAELYNIEDPTAESYYRNLTQSDLAPLDNLNLDFTDILNFNLPDGTDGSNNWVVGPDKSATGKPLLANDPHLSLQTPSIWWRVHLYAPSFHVEGYSLPGVPGIIIGHNDHVAWGVTNTGLDAVDLFYFKTNSAGTQYWIDDQWKNFSTVTQHIPVKGQADTTYDVKYTDYGPVLDPQLFDIPDSDGLVWVMRWTLLENYSRDQIVKSVIDYNRATNADEFRSALEYFGVPSQNFVYATVDGDFGYQFSGIAPIRKVPGSGIIPQNGSDSRFGWNGIVPYEDQLNVTNPAKGFFGTANQKIDTRDNYYVSDHYDVPYRGERINSVLADDNNVTIGDMRALQGDTYNLYAKRVLDQTIDAIKTATYPSSIEKKAATAMNFFLDWYENSLRMNRKEIGATIFTTFRVFLAEQTFKDEFESKGLIYDDYTSRAIHGMSQIIDNPDSHWWNDVSTTANESRDDIAIRAYTKTISYLLDNAGNIVRNWRYERIHKVVFEHPFGINRINSFIFNEGNKGSDGSDITVKASGSTPAYENGKISYTQTHGPSMRFIAQVEPNWGTVEGILPPGQSEHFFTSHRGNNVDDWINNVNHPWEYRITYDRQPSFTYIKK